MTTKESIDRHGETHIVSATCGLCHTVHAKVPVNPPTCAGCGATGCDQCEHQWAMFTCDSCDDVICAADSCMRKYAGSVICMKVACKDKAKETEAHVQKVKEEQRKAKVPSWRRAS